MISEEAIRLIQKKEAHKWDAIAAREQWHIPVLPKPCLGLREDDPDPKQKDKTPYWRIESVIP